MIFPWKTEKTPRRAAASLPPPGASAAPPRAPCALPPGAPTDSQAHRGGWEEKPWQNHGKTWDNHGKPMESWGFGWLIWVRSSLVGRCWKMLGNKAIFVLFFVWECGEKPGTGWRRKSKLGRILVGPILIKQKCNGSYQHKNACKITYIYILIGTSTLHFYITYILLWFLNGWFHLRIRRAGFSVQAPPGCSGKVRRGWTTHRPAQIAQIHWFRL